MKPKLIFCLALILGGLLRAVGSTAMPPDVTKDGAPQWGKRAGGFEMAVALDETNGIIHCRIRNATTNELDYSSFDVGYMENISLEIHGATNWMKFGDLWLPTLPRSLGIYGGRPYFVKRAQPGQVITVTYTRSRAKPWPVQPFGDYLKWTKGNTNEALLTEKLNQWYASRDALEAATGHNDTFAIDLFEMHQWTPVPPVDSLEARVSQSFRTNSMKGWMITVYSPNFTISSSLLQSCAKARNALTIRRANKP